MTDTIFKIYHENVESYIGKFAWPTLILGVFIIALYSTLTLLVVTEQMHLGVGILLASCLYYMGYAVLHEAVHENISGKNDALAWVNDVLGFFMGQILCVSYCAHRKQHLKNHSHRDESISHQRENLLQSTILVAKLQYRNYFTNNLERAQLTERCTVFLEIGLMIVGRGFLVFHYTGLNVALFFTGALLLGTLILVVLFIWCVHPTFSKETSYQNTITYIFPKPIHMPLTWLWLFQNYHIIHHLFPNVPFYKYQKLFYEIETKLIQKNARIVRL